MQSNSPKYHSWNFWFEWFGSSAKIQSFSKFHLLHFRIIMMKFARSSWENCRIWTVLRIQHVDGAFEEEGSVCHLQLLQGVVTCAITLIALESENNGKTNTVQKKIIKKITYTSWSANQNVFLLITGVVYGVPGSLIYSWQATVVSIQVSNNKSEHIMKAVKGYF